MPHDFKQKIYSIKVDSLKLAIVWSEGSKRSLHMCENEFLCPGDCFIPLVTQELC